MGTCIPEHSTSCLAGKKRFRHVSLCMQGFIQEFMLGGDGGTFVNPRHACAARVTVLGLSVCVCMCVCVCVCVSESVTSLTATPLTHRYKGRYDSNANALLRFLTRGFR